MQNLIKDIKVSRVMNAVAVGTTTQTAAAPVDMSGWDGVTFIALFGTITDGTPGLKARQDTVVGMGGAADLAGTLTSAAITDDNRAIVLDVYRPLERYVDCQVLRGGATGAVIDGVSAIQDRGRKSPVTQDTSHVASNKSVVSPSEGTA